MIKITPYRTFGVKQFKIIVNNEDLLLVNLFGFGLWILKTKAARKHWSITSEQTRRARI